jgi:Carboxypeptidase regulatory-like domain/TonB dependent receptor
MIPAMRFVLLSILPCALFSQTAQLSGLIKDPQSGAVPNASVEVRNEETGGISRTTSNADGIYVVPALNPGKYDLTAQAAGFKTLTRDGIVLEVAQRARLDITLEVGAVADTVTVSGDASMTNTADASVSTVVDRQFVENIPLNGRSFQSLIALTPGTVITSTAGGQDQGQFSVAGQRAGSNYFSIDGVGVNFAAAVGNYQAQNTNGSLPAFSALGSTASLVSVDALQEFRLESSTYAPEYGRQSGAQVMLVTRSGTNSFHGTAFDYLRNDALDAADWFADATGQAKGRERQNDFGGVFGGPIIKDKTFFFFSYEGLRVAQPLFQISDVPSLAARAAAAPSTKAIVDAFPLPNGPITGVDIAQLAESVPNHSDLDATSLRIDHTLNSKITLFGRYNHSPSSVSQAFGWPGNNPTIIAQDIDTATVGLTAILTPTTTDEFHANFSRSHAQSFGVINSFGGAVAPSDTALLSPWQNVNTGWSFFDVESGRSTMLGPGPSGNNVNRQLNLTDSVAIAKGTHLMKFGFDFRRLKAIQGIPLTGGEYLWLTANSLVSGATPDYMAVVVDDSNIRQAYYNYSLFAQDTWKISPRLTLTYGVRWDYNPPPTETNGAANAPYTLSEISNLATATLLPRGSPLWHADWKNFAPRIGMAYQLGSSKERPTVIRAGFGQFYDLGTSTAGFLDNGEGWFPYSIAVPLCVFGSGPACNSSAPYTGPEPPVAFTQPYSGFMKAFDPHLKLPYALEWNVAIEKTLSPNQIFKVTYLGSAGRRLLRDDVVGNPNPILSNVYLTKNIGYSNYDALQLQFERRLSHGLQALVSYNWSHSLDLNSSDYSYGNTVGIPSNLYNLRQDYGDSDFDIRQSFSAALTYNIPTVSFQNSFARSVLRDWSLDSINSARTGLPFNVLYTPASPGAYTDGEGDPLQFRPDQVLGQPVWISDSNAPGGKELNLAAFSIPSVLQQGTEGRNNIRGFPMLEMDLAVRRQFNLTERVHLQFRAEGFNFINHPNFGNPLNAIGTCSLGVPCTPVYGWGTSQAMLNQSLGASNFHGTALGSLYQVGGPRSIQLSMKLQF